MDCVVYKTWSAKSDRFHSNNETMLSTNGHSGNYVHNLPNFNLSGIGFPMGFLNLIYHTFRNFYEVILIFLLYFFMNMDFLQCLPIDKTLVTFSATILILSVWETIVRNLIYVQFARTWIHKFKWLSPYFQRQEMTDILLSKSCVALTRLFHLK